MDASVNEYLKRIKHNLQRIDTLTVDFYAMSAIRDLVSIVEIQGRNISALEKLLDGKADRIHGHSSLSSNA
jgi:hypothetical protein